MLLYLSVTIIVVQTPVRELLSMLGGLLLQQAFQRSVSSDLNGHDTPWSVKLSNLQSRRIQLRPTWEAPRCQLAVAANQSTRKIHSDQEMIESEPLLAQRGR